MDTKYLKAGDRVALTGKGWDDTTVYPHGAEVTVGERYTGRWSTPDTLKVDNGCFIGTSSKGVDFSATLIGRGGKRVRRIALGKRSTWPGGEALVIEYQDGSTERFTGDGARSNRGVEDIDTLLRVFFREQWKVIYEDDKKEVDEVTKFKSGDRVKVKSGAKSKFGWRADEREGTVSNLNHYDKTYTVAAVFDGDDVGNRLMRPQDLILVTEEDKPALPATMDEFEAKVKAEADRLGLCDTFDQKMFETFGWASRTPRRITVEEAVDLLRDVARDNGHQAQFERLFPPSIPWPTGAHAMVEAHVSGKNPSTLFRTPTGEWTSVKTWKTYSQGDLILDRVIFEGEEQ